jgi:hypothetical protein
VRGLAFLLLVLAIAGTALGAVGIAYGLIEDPYFLGPSIGLLIVPWVLWLVVRGRATDEGKATFDAALAAFPASHSAWHKGSGLALDRDGTTLLVASRGQVASHPLTAVSAVRFVPESAGSVSAAGASSMGILGVILALFAIGSATAGHLESGLFLTIGGRTWQVFGLSKAAANEWIERLRAAAPHIEVMDSP